MIGEEGRNRLAGTADRRSDDEIYVGLLGFKDCESQAFRSAKTIRHRRALAVLIGPYPLMIYRRERGRRDARQGRLGTVQMISVPAEGVRGENAS